MPPEPEQPAQLVVLDLSGEAIFPSPFPLVPSPDVADKSDVDSTNDTWTLTGPCATGLFWGQILSKLREYANKVRSFFVAKTLTFEYGADLLLRNEQPVPGTFILKLVFSGDLAPCQMPRRFSVSYCSDGTMRRVWEDKLSLAAASYVLPDSPDWNRRRRCVATVLFRPDNDVLLSGRRRSEVFTPPTTRTDCHGAGGAARKAARHDDDEELLDQERRAPDEEADLGAAATRVKSLLDSLYSDFLHKGVDPRAFSVRQFTEEHLSSDVSLIPIYGRVHSPPTTDQREDQGRFSRITSGHDRRPTHFRFHSRQHAESLVRKLKALDTFPVREPQAAQSELQLDDDLNATLTNLARSYGKFQPWFDRVHSGFARWYPLGWDIANFSQNPIEEASHLGELLLSDKFDHAALFCGEEIVDEHWRAPSEVGSKSCWKVHAVLKTDTRFRSGEEGGSSQEQGA